jgi:hypothetical protein
VDRRRTPRRKLVVPIVLAVSLAGTVTAAVSTSSGCGSDKPTVDAGTDAPHDTPLV